MTMDRRTFIATSTAAGAVSIAVGVTGAATIPGLRHGEVPGPRVRFLSNGEPISEWHPINLTVIDDVVTPSGTVPYIPLEKASVSRVCDGWELDIPNLPDSSFKFDTGRLLMLSVGSTVTWEG